MLASIQKINEVFPIPNADNIEGVKILGWEVVVKKGEFKKGDLCIYIEIDSLIPKREWSDFLFKDTGTKEYHRLRTVKLRKQISQGLVLPITIEMFPSTEYVGFHLRVGDDVTSFLGIEKYEKEIPVKLRGQIKGSFPSFLHKTDEDKIQSRPEFLEQLKGKPYYITTKMDGTSATYYKYKGKFGVCSRNLELKDPRTPKGFLQWAKREIRKLIGKTKKEVPSTTVYWNMVDKYKIDLWLPNGYAIQGEICGPNIQGNRLNLNEHKLFIFNYFDINNQQYLDPSTVSISSKLGLEDCIDLVWVEEWGTSFDFTLEELLEMAKGKYLNTNNNKEGIVVRSNDQTISFKVLNNEYLLKDEE